TTMMDQNTRQPSPVPTGRSMADEAVRHGAIDLAQGVLHAEPPQVLLDLLAEISRTPRVHAYASPQGVPEYLEAVVHLLNQEGLPATSANVLGSSGNTGGLMAALIAHCQPGDRVLLPEPFYPAHLWAIRAARCEPVFLRRGNDFLPDEEDLRAQLSRVRAILMTNPSNPSGVVWPRSLLRRLADLAAEQNVLLVSDETYKDYIWEGEFVSPLSLANDWSSLVALRGFSKTLAIAGWRTGYTVSTTERIRTMTDQIHDALYVGAPSLPQYVLARALRDHREELKDFLRQNVALYRENRTQIADIFLSLGMEPVLPQGAFYMLVKHNRADDVTAMKELLAHGVAVAPGIPFFADQTKPSGYIRVHFAVSRDTVQRVREKLLTLGR
ncbi:MAG: pyridoxal phosphate-dependent aminotransferase, partial [bacterium]|nr:pyridoxal phosphate-dependent aminotransferase [bacterium]